jgi:hypothetical protein
VVIFYDESFPYEGQRPTKELLKKLQEQAEIVQADELTNALDREIVPIFQKAHGVPLLLI